ncbi:hypothetical protein Lauda_00037 [Pseudomonas phage vB_PpuM-Lauda]
MNRTVVKLGIRALKLREMYTSSDWHVSFDLKLAKDFLDKQATETYIKLAQSVEGCYFLDVAEDGNPIKQVDPVYVELSLAIKSTAIISFAKALMATEGNLFSGILAELQNMGLIAFGMVQIPDPRFLITRPTLDEGDVPEGKVYLLQGHGTKLFKKLSIATTIPVDPQGNPIGLAEPVHVKWPAQLLEVHFDD